MGTPQRHFDDQYRECATLADGTQALLRLVRPSDKELLIEGLARLSDESRYLRFFAPKSQLSPKELVYLTEIDGENHFALGAVRALDAAEEQGLGVARFIRCADDPRMAEAAIVVVDEAQGNGLGRLLFLRLAAAARERGVEVFRSDVLAKNLKMRALLRKLAPGAKEHTQDGIITVEASVPAVLANVPREHPSGRETNYRLLTLAAERSLQVRPPSIRHPRVGAWGDDGER